jgi:hypothetical protein
MSELVPAGVPPPGPGRDGCPHEQRVEGVCAACGHCLHDVILNGACLYCGTTDLDPIALSPKKTPDLIAPERLTRKP